MAIYFFTIFLLFGFSIMEASASQSSIEKFPLMVISFIFLVFQIGLRWETGTDWIPYISNFESAQSSSTFEPDGQNFEPGYYLFTYLISRFTNNYSVLLFLHSIIFFYFLFRSFRAFSPAFFIALLFFYTLFMGVTGANRQLLALVFGLMGIKNLVANKKVNFFLWIALAFTFHFSSILFLTYFLVNRRINVFVWIIIILICVGIGYSSLPVSLFSSFSGFSEHAVEKADAYLKRASQGTGEGQLSVIGLIKRLVIGVTFLSLRSRLEKLIPKYNLFLNGYLIGISFYFLFSTSLQIMISRGSLYFTIMEPILMSFLLVLIPSRKYMYIIQLLFLLMSIFYFQQSISPYADLFDPYKGVFINSDLSREMY